MTPKTVKTLGVVTLLFCAGAWFANSFRASDSKAAGAGDFAFPGLREKINDVEELVIETQDGKATLKRVDGQWTFAEKGGYPAKDTKVREVLMELRGAEIVEQKTADPNKFTKLGLDEPGAEGSSSKRVTVKDGSGAEIATALIGDQRSSKAAPQPGRPSPKGQSYIHTGDEGPALLVDGEFMLDVRPNTWLDQQILSLPATRMRAVRVSQPDGEALELYRQDMSEADFEILSIPEGMEPKSPSATRGFMSTLSGLRFEDVKKASELDWAAEGVVTTEYFTEHGLRVTVRSIEVPEGGPEKDPAMDPLGGADPTVKTWTTMTVDVVDPADLPGAPAEDPAGDAAAGPPPEGEGEAGTDATIDTGPTAPTQAELEAEANELQKITEGWAFALPSWKTGPLRLRAAEALQAVPEPEPEPEPDTEPDTDTNSKAGLEAGGDAAPKGDGDAGPDGTGDKGKSEGGDQ